MQTIKMKIMLSMLSLVILGVLITGGVLAVSSYSSTVDTLEKTLAETVEIAAQQVSATMMGYQTLAVNISHDAIIAQQLPSRLDPTYDEVRLEIVERASDLMELHGLASLNIFDADGINLNNGVEMAQGNYDIIKSTLQPNITDPSVRASDGAMLMFVMAPILDNGELAGIISMGVDPMILSEMVSSMQIGVNGDATVISSSGVTIAYKDVDIVLEQFNAQTAALSDPELEALAAMEKDLVAGNTGIAEYTYAGIEQVSAYTPVPNTNGWGIYVNAVAAEFMGTLYNSLAISAALVALIIITSIIVIIVMANKISKPIVQCSKRLDLLSKGDLESPLPNFTSKDETGQLLDATKSIVGTLNVIIPDLCEGFADMASGNFDLQSNVEDAYVGAFKPLADSMYELIEKMSGTLLQIDTAAKEVTSGAEMVATGSQSLAQGSTEQASSVEELAESLGEISQKILNTSNESQNAKIANAKAQDALTESNQKMSDMMASMNKIDEKSQEISKIIKAIDDIAFQTNILSLNAAVEAARAGSAGKGFAVVADEVRNLANKSAQSAKDTATLISDALAAVEDGNRIAKQTSTAIHSVLENTAELATIVDNIANASQEQSEAMQSVNVGIDQINIVVQGNAATSEESAATSEQLSSQAQTLKHLVGQFKLSQNITQKLLNEKK